MPHCFIQHDQQTILTLSGSLDSEEALTLKSVIDQFIETESKDLTVDMAQISFLDSSGIGLLVYAFKRLRSENRQMALRDVQGQPEDLMKMLRIDKAISMESTKGEAA
ncbi:MAG: STAS domain-containing protein [Rickettsiales bacterium]|nr:STAS domain-containing protein [Rickettsiales bacterium]